MIEFHGEACSRNPDVTDENRTQNIHALGGENGYGKTPRRENWKNVRSDLGGVNEDRKGCFGLGII